jgi:hypothetical protein
MGKFASYSGSIHHGTTFHTSGCAEHVMYLSKMKVVGAYKSSAFFNPAKSVPKPFEADVSG